jgi:hypothetical protein
MEFLKIIWEIIQALCMYVPLFLNKWIFKLPFFNKKKCKILIIT